MCDTFKREFRCRNLWTDASNLADFTSSTVSLYKAHLMAGGDYR